jgi:hypothetical protein
MYTPERAGRLAAQSRQLWRDLRRTVDQLLKSAYDPCSDEGLAMSIRTLQIVLRGYSPEQRDWTNSRSEAVPYGDRDGEVGLFHFMNELDDIMDRRLKALHRAVSEFDKMQDDHGLSREEYFGAAFCDQLATLQVVWDDWNSISGIFEQIDCGPQDTDHIAQHLPAWEKELAAVEKRTASRRPRAAAQRRKSPKKRHTPAKSASRPRPRKG